MCAVDRTAMQVGIRGEEESTTISFARSSSTFPFKKQYTRCSRGSQPGFLNDHEERYIGGAQVTQ